MRKRQLTARVSNMTGIPKDVVLGVPLIRMVGQEELYIENYRGSFVRIQTRIGQLHLTGKHMEIVYYTNDEMKVVGRIESLTYHQGGTL